MLENWHRCSNVVKKYGKQWQLNQFKPKEKVVEESIRETAEPEKPDDWTEVTKKTREKGKKYMGERNVDEVNCSNGFDSLEVGNDSIVELIIDK